VVPSKKVEEAVREQHRDLVEDGRATRARLLPRGLHAHNDVAENGPSQRGELALAHREGKDVRGAILPAIDLVQFVNTFVVS